MCAGRPKRTKQFTQDEYDRLPADKQAYYRKNRPDILENVNYEIKRPINRKEQFTKEEFEALPAYSKFYYRNKRPELLENIKV